MSNKLVTAYDMIKARDAAIDELQNEVNRLAPYEMFYERTLKRAEAAERRVAELEAQLTAQAWRPVTEPPTEAGDYLVWVKYDGEPGFCAVCGWDRVLQWDDNFVHPKYWHPLPSLNL